MHIRRGDHIKSKKHSPLEAFMKQMKNEIKDHPDCCFFLATDSVSEEEILKREFGERIIVHQKILDRNTEQGIIDAVIDLLCLSSTNKIIGSHYSSFPR
ncbi:MAG: hypothetical protein HC906_18745 [Bacteroidales bacterium]|nr:hypothetical protein [Bacteroidales bacterium]